MVGLQCFSCSVSTLSDISQAEKLSRAAFALWLEAAYWSAGFCYSAACISHYTSVTFYFSGLFIFSSAFKGYMGMS